MKFLLKFNIPYFGKVYFNPSVYYYFFSKKDPDSKIDMKILFAEEDRYVPNLDVNTIERFRKYCEKMVIYNDMIVQDLYVYVNKSLQNLNSVNVKGKLETELEIVDNDMKEALEKAAGNNHFLFLVPSNVLDYWEVVEGELCIQK